MAVSAERAVRGLLMPEVRLLPPPASVMWTKFDLAAVGYLAEEFVISGHARAYSHRPSDNLTSPEIESWARYTSRITVFRPSDVRRYSGTAMVEWLNCRDGVDTAPQWIRMHRHMIRAGIIWVGVSAQRGGIEGCANDQKQRYLKALDARRYACLEHPGDAYALDIFSQAATLVGLGALRFSAPTCILAAGSSQAARFLTTYANVIDPIAQILDGFLLTGRHRSAASLEGDSICGNTVPLLEDARVPIFVLQSETDPFGRMQSADVRQADTHRIRTWEIAGAAHADSYMAKVGNIDDGRLDGPALAAAYAVDPGTWLPLRSPMNSSPAFHYVHQAALHHLEHWVRSGNQPPIGNYLEGNAATGIARDSPGIARGGVRTPWVDCPACIYRGDNDESGEFEGLFGRTEPLPPEILRSRYSGGVCDFLTRFSTALQASIAAGFILEDDAAECLELARAQFAGT